MPIVLLCGEKICAQISPKLSNSMTINCRGHLLDLSRPVVMGILNATPDSFYEKSRAEHEADILEKATQMLLEGASIIDIGGQSTRPGAAQVPENEELMRTIPAISAILKRFPDAVVSIDTYRSTVARAAVEAGASIINDVSGGVFDEKMFATAADLKVPYICMFMPNPTHETMHARMEFTDILTQTLDFFIEKTGKLRALGVVDVILDPGFGFGKSVAENYLLLKKMHVLAVVGCPVLAGLSRKSMIWKTLGTSPAESLVGTAALNMVALQQGAKILRVHDVRAAVEVIRLFGMMDY